MTPLAAYVLQLLTNATEPAFPVSAQAGSTQTTANEELTDEEG